MTELMEQALSMLSVGLRLAVQAKKRSENIEKGFDSWALALSGAIPADLQARLDEYNKGEVCQLPLNTLSLLNTCGA